MPRPGSKKKGGARLSERGLASYLRERYYFGAEDSPAHILYRFLSAVVHSPNTKPMPPHPFNTLLEGNEASADRALAEIIKANGWQRYVKDNGAWGQAPQGYAVIPSASAPASASASASAPAPAPAPYVAPSAPWASAGKRKPVADPGGGGEEYPPPPPATGLSFDMAGAELGDEDEDEEGELAEVAPPPPPPPPPVAQPAERGEPPKPRAKKPKPESKEVDLEAEARASKIAYFQEAREALNKERDIPSLGELTRQNRAFNDEILRLNALGQGVSKKRSVLEGLKARYKQDIASIADALRQMGTEGNRRAEAFNKELDALKKNPPDAERRREAHDAEREALEMLKSRIAQMKSEAETLQDKSLKIDRELKDTIAEGEANDKMGLKADKDARATQAQMASHPAQRYIKTLKEKGLLDEYTEWVKQEGQRQLEAEGKGRYRGGVVPERAVLQKMAKDSYSNNPAKYIGNSTLLKSTPTIKFYINGNTIIVSIRGSQTQDDWLNANVRIPINQLKSSNRFKQDSVIIKDFQRQYPKGQYEYYGIAHSLGGALLDEFIREGIIDRGLSYNPAIQTQDFNNTASKNERIYYEGDPLYKTMGRMLTNAPEVRKAPQQSWWKKAISVIPGIGDILNYGIKANDLVQGHDLSNFEGGRKSAVSPTPSNPLSREEYLSRVRAKAKSEGYPYKLLGYADDTKHKFQIPNPDGKIIRFGRDGYGDFHIWSALEASGKVAKGYAENKRKVFHNSHNKIKGRWRSDLFSPNNLALKILW